MKANSYSNNLCHTSSNPSLRLGEGGGGVMEVGGGGGGVGGGGGRHEATLQSRDGQKPCSCQAISDIAQKRFNLCCNLTGIP